MSETIYSKKYLKPRLNFRKTAFSQEDRKMKENIKSIRNIKDSFNISNKYKTSINFRKINNIINSKNEEKNISAITKNMTVSKRSNKSPIIPIKIHKFFNFRFNKAPTLKQNKGEINNIIKKKNIKKMNELKNIYNNILINESKSFRNSLYVTGNVFLNKKTILKKNRSCDELGFQKYNSYKSNNKINNSAEDSSLFTGLNFNSSKNIYDNEAKPINQSIIIQNNNKSNNIDNQNFLPSLSNTNRKNIFKPTKSISKARILVNDVIFNELNTVKEFSEKENKMIKFRIIQNIQCKEIHNMDKKEENYLDNKINRLMTLKNFLDNKFIKYIYEMDKYNFFLNEIIYEIQSNMKIIDKEIFNKNIDIEKLILKIVNKQKDLEYLIEIKNFLLKVKDKYENNEKSSSYYFKLFIKDSKKLLIGNYFLNLKIINQITNKKVTSFISSFLELKEKIEDNKIFLDDFDYNLNHFKREKIKPVFYSVDEFIKIYNSHMEKNMIYLQQFEWIKKILNKLKYEYNEVCITDNNITILEEEIKEKSEIKEKLIKKNELLKKKYIYYKEHIRKNRSQIEINLKKTNKIPAYLDINIDLDSINREKYNKKIRALKYKGLLLLQKIIIVSKNFFKTGYDKKDFYKKFIKKDNLSLLELKPNDFNDDNIQLIDDYILKIISIYEDICKYTLSNHQKYISDKNNLEIIFSKKEEIDNERKLKISKEQKKMKIIKNNEEMHKIIEKCYKPILYIENKMITDAKIKRRKMLKRKGEKQLEDEEKNFAEKEFNNFTKYSDENVI